LAGKSFFSKAVIDVLARCDQRLGCLGIA